MALMSKDMIRLSRSHGFRCLVGCSHRGGGRIEDHTSRMAGLTPPLPAERLEGRRGQRRNVVLPGHVLEVIMKPS